MAEADRLIALEPKKTGKWVPRIERYANGTFQISRTHALAVLPEYYIW